VQRKTSGLEGVGKGEWTKMSNEKFLHCYTSKTTAGYRINYDDKGVACDTYGTVEKCSVCSRVLLGRSRLGRPGFR
jgi:hypothetical protein